VILDTKKYKSQQISELQSRMNSLLKEKINSYSSELLSVGILELGDLENQNFNPSEKFTELKKNILE
jgi:hypothetical protein